jgi:hypothetical protein
VKEGLFTATLPARKPERWRWIELKKLIDNRQCLWKEKGRMSDSGRNVGRGMVKKHPSNETEI